LKEKNQSVKFEKSTYSPASDKGYFAFEQIGLPDRGFEVGLAECIGHSDVI
jgi:hypothetical protein